MIETLKISTNSNFRLCKRSGKGVNDTQYEELVVISDNLADKYVVEIRLESDYLPYIGEFVRNKYGDVYIAHGMRSVNESLSETKEYVDVLNEAIEFAYTVKDFINSNDEWKM